MFRTVLDTDGLLREEKTAAWMEAAALALVPKRCRVPEPERFAARALYHEIRAFIRRHVDDPDLTPPAVAAAHCISTRTLHRIFQTRGETVSGTIRAERINRCRRDLADPGLRAVPVGSVGARWGFPRASDFTRAFKAATGMTPTVYRASLQEQDS